MIRLAFYVRVPNIGNRSEARASDLRRYPGLWWNRINQFPYDGKESEYSPRTCSIGRPAGGPSVPPPITSQVPQLGGLRPLPITHLKEKKNCYPPDENSRSLSRYTTRIMQ